MGYSLLFAVIKGLVVLRRRFLLTFALEIWQVESGSQHSDARWASEMLGDASKKQRGYLR